MSVAMGRARLPSQRKAAALAWTARPPHITPVVTCMHCVACCGPWSAEQVFRGFLDSVWHPTCPTAKHFLQVPYDYWAGEGHPWLHDARGHSAPSALLVRRGLARTGGLNVKIPDTYTNIHPDERIVPLAASRPAAFSWAGPFASTPTDAAKADTASTCAFSTSGNSALRVPGQRMSHGELPDHAQTRSSHHMEANSAPHAQFAAAASVARPSVRRSTSAYLSQRSARGFRPTQSTQRVSDGKRPSGAFPPVAKPPRQVIGSLVRAGGGRGASGQHASQPGDAENATGPFPGNDTILPHFRPSHGHVDALAAAHERHMARRANLRAARAPAPPPREHIRTVPPPAPTAYDAGRITGTIRTTPAPPVPRRPLARTTTQQNLAASVNAQQRPSDTTAHVLAGRQSQVPAAPLHDGGRRAVSMNGRGDGLVGDSPHNEFQSPGQCCSGAGGVQRSQAPSVAKLRSTGTLTAAPVLVSVPPPSSSDMRGLGSRDSQVFGGRRSAVARSRGAAVHSSAKPVREGPGARGGLHHAASTSCLPRCFSSVREGGVE